jgi:hypothetical protein
MKVLFCGPLLDFSGFAHASRAFLKTLQQDSNLQVAARALKYDRLDGGQKFEPEQKLKDVLQVNLQDVDMALQMTTCNIEAHPVPGVCNGLYTFLETDRLQIQWATKANEFDFLMVPCRANAQALLNSGVTKPVLVCPPP